jgi:hypothetical protein
MRLLLAMTLCASIANPVMAQETAKPADELARLNQLLVQLVRVEILSEKLATDRAALQELLGESRELSVALEASAPFPESYLAELDERDPDLARQQRGVMAARQAKAADLRSQRDVVEGRIRAVKARIDASLRSLDLINQRIEAIEQDMAREHSGDQ